MARRQDHSREELRLLLLSEARKIVAQEGLAALTVRRLAGAVSYSVGTVYNVFRNLDELVMELNAETLDQLHTFAGERCPKEGAPEARLLALADCYIDFMRRYGRLWSALFEHRLPPGVPLPDWYLVRIFRLFRLIEDALAALFPALESSARLRMARLLWASIHGICSLATADKLGGAGEDDARAMARSLVANYLAGARARAASGAEP